MDRRILVIGGSLPGVQAALDLAESGFPVTLVEESDSLLGGGEAARTATLPYVPSLLKAANHPDIRIITGARVADIKRGRRLSARITAAPRFVDPAACTSCGRCERVCPVEIRSRSGDVPPYKAIHRPAFGMRSVPSAYAIEKQGVPPCTAACPGGINVHGYVALISKGKFAEALDLVTEAVPFPRVLGRVCSHPCESKCTRGKVDKPIAICSLKRYVADHNSTESSLKRAQEANHKESNGLTEVAIIGAGPAGLTAARDLARLGHKSVVLEALPVPGGMITVGMPRFRLPRETRQADINEIIRLGIEIRTSTRVGTDISLSELREKYKAVLIATGSHKNQRLGIPGEGLSGVINSIAFLQALNLKQPVTVGSRAAVIGGGYTAIDSARTAVRLHCQEVKLLYRRSLEEMPANPEEVDEARQEGVQIEFLVAPVRILGQEGKVTGVECIRMALGEPDKSGRRRPIPQPGTEFIIEVDTVIVAVGQRSDLSFLEGDTTLTDGKRSIAVDRLTMASKTPGIFAAGDVTGETGTMIEAIAEGRRAAASIDRYLRGENMAAGRTLKSPPTVEAQLDEAYIPPIERQQMPVLRLGDRLGNFEEVDLGFGADMAVQEAARCLNCGGCSECFECTRACELNAIDHKAVPDVSEIEVDALVAAAACPGLKDAPGVYLIPPGLSGDAGVGSALAERIIRELGGARNGHIAVTPAPPEVALPAGFRGGIILCRCGGNISDHISLPEVAEYGRGLRGVAWASEVGYACTREAAAEIKAIVAEHNLSHVVVAGCACCNLGQICYSCSDRRIECKTNLLDGAGAYYDFVNIREHCAWVHRARPEAAAVKAAALIRAALARAALARAPKTIDPALTGIARGDIGSLGTPAVIDESRCRGCGDCVKVCRPAAIRLLEKGLDFRIARVDRSQCTGCGACLGVCPTGAISQEGFEETGLVAALEALWKD